MFRMTTLALLVGSATCAWAQDDTLTLPASNVTATANQPKEATSLDLDRPIESGSRLNLSARENPASVSVADRKTMERIGARNFRTPPMHCPGLTPRLRPAGADMCRTEGSTVPRSASCSMASICSMAARRARWAPGSTTASNCSAGPPPSSTAAALSVAASISSPGWQAVTKTPSKGASVMHATTPWKRRSPSTRR